MILLFSMCMCVYICIDLYIRGCIFIHMHIYLPQCLFLCVLKYMCVWPWLLTLTFDLDLGIEWPWNLRNQIRHTQKPPKPHLVQLFRLSKSWDITWPKLTSMTQVRYPRAGELGVLSLKAPMLIINILVPKYLKKQVI